MPRARQIRHVHRVVLVDARPRRLLRRALQPVPRRRPRARVRGGGRRGLPECLLLRERGRRDRRRRRQGTHVRHEQRAKLRRGHRRPGRLRHVVPLLAHEPGTRRRRALREERRVGRLARVRERRSGEGVVAEEVGRGACARVAVRRGGRRAPLRGRGAHDVVDDAAEVHRARDAQRVD